MVRWLLNYIHDVEEMITVGSKWSLWGMAIIDNDGGVEPLWNLPKKLCTMGKLYARNKQFKISEEINPDKWVKQNSSSYKFLKH
jgi:hypothetical protein